MTIIHLARVVLHIQTFSEDDAVEFFLENHVCMGILQMLLSLIVLVINRKFFIQGFGVLLHKGTNMDTLVALGSSASFGYSLAALFVMAYAMGNGDTSMRWP